MKFTSAFVSFVTAISVLMLPHLANSQQLGQVTFSKGSQLSYFSFLTDQGVLIRVSDDGKILEWGTEVLSDRYNFYAQKLQPFMGRTEYYGPQDDSLFRGKVKSIGTCFITYYDTFQVKSKIGKLKSIGRVQLDYFEDYEDKILKGKIKTAGVLSIDYYRSYENENLRGKLKSVGSTPIAYYTVFDDKINAGKLKTIGSAQFSWYSLGDRSDMRGALKSNNYRQVVSGVIYILY
ncbi:MAG TPA: hypothetical protein VL095_00375 [Flavisolibacter sp.]|nr:hypothetical protein [Flavisolibacter sp.]